MSGENWVAEADRKFTDARDFLKDALKKSESDLNSEGIASYVSKAMAKHFSVLEDADVARMARTGSGFATFITNYFSRRII